MKKGLLLVLAGLMAFFGMTAQSMASSRMDSMGADYRQFDDQDQIWLYPNKALLYKDTIDFRLNGTYDGEQDFGTVDGIYGEWGGVLKDAGDVGVIGAYFNRPNRLPNGFAYSNQDYYGDYPARSWVDSPLYGQPFSPVGDVGDWSNNSPLPTLNAYMTPENKADFFWANSMSGIDLGFVINYGDAQQYVANGSVYSQTLGINIGAGFGAVGPFASLNAHLGYQMGSDYENNVIKDNGIYTIPVGLMGDITLDANNTLRVFVDGNLNQFSLQNIAVATPFSEKYASSHFLLGSAVNKKIAGGKGLASLGLFAAYGDAEISTTQNTNKEDTAYWDLIANISVETPLSSWLTWRAGYTRMFFERYYNSNGGGAGSYGDSWLSYYNPASGPYGYDQAGQGWGLFDTGFSVNVENWTLDAYLSTSALENFIGDPGLGWIVNGQGGNNQPPLEVIGMDAKLKI